MDWFAWRPGARGGVRRGFVCAPCSAAPPASRPVWECPKPGFNARLRPLSCPAPAARLSTLAAAVGWDPAVPPTRACRAPMAPPASLRALPPPPLPPRPRQPAATGGGSRPTFLSWMDGRQCQLAAHHPWRPRVWLPPEAAQHGRGAHALQVWARPRQGLTPARDRRQTRGVLLFSQASPGNINAAWRGA